MGLDELIDDRFWCGNRAMFFRKRVLRLISLRNDLWDGCELLAERFFGMGVCCLLSRSCSVRGDCLLEGLLKSWLNGLLNSLLHSLLIAC